MSDIKVGDKFLGFKFSDTDTEGTLRMGYAPKMNNVVGVEQTICIIDGFGDIYTDNGWWYPTDHPKFKIIGSEVKKEKEVKKATTIKVNAYAIVNTKTGAPVEFCSTRKSARFWLSEYKTHIRDHYRIVRLGPVGFTR